MSDTQQQNNIFHTDRSRIVATHRCPRARFFGYEVQVSPEQVTLGITPERLSLPMLIGSSVHQGLEILHRFHCIGDVVPNVRDLSSYAVEKALEYYDLGVAAHEASIIPEDVAEDEWMDSAPGDQSESRKLEFKIKEGRMMTEALVRVYSEVGLVKLLAQYEILLVEKEMSSVIAEDESNSLGVQLNGRADAILRERSSGALATLSIKTAKDLDARSSKNWMEDDQGISECYLIQQLVQQGKLEEFGIQPFDEVQVGVQMLYLLKGREYADKADGIWKHGNAITRPFAQEQPSGEVFLKPKYNIVNPDTGKPGTLGTKWRATPIWDTGWEVSTWIAEMLVNDLEVLDSMCLMPNLYIRSEAEISNWVVEAGMQEMNFAILRLDMARAQGSMNLSMILAGEFPKHRNSCNYPVACDFKVLCHPVAGELGMSEVGEAMVTQGLVQLRGFKVRTANHAIEGDAQ